MIEKRYSPNGHILFPRQYFVFKKWWQYSTTSFKNLWKEWEHLELPLCLTQYRIHMFNACPLLWMNNYNFIELYANHTCSSVNSSEEAWPILKRAQQRTREQMQRNAFISLAEVVSVLDSENLFLRLSLLVIYLRGICRCVWTSSAWSFSLYRGERNEYCAMAQWIRNITCL